MTPTGESVSEGVDLSGTTALVTGATSGLGRECARVLALRGARVVLACRDAGKGRATIEAFARSIGEEAAARCALGECDLTSMRSVRALADSIDRVDRLFLNAGVFGLPFELTSEGHERTFAANFLGHFLLVHRLLQRDALGPHARVVATLSEGVLNPLVRVDLEAIEGPARYQRRYSSFGASPATKVMLARMGVELARRAHAPAITFNSVMPPTTLTDNVNQGAPFLRGLGRLIGPLLFRPVEEGAAVLVWAATSPDLAERTGEIFSSRMRPVRLSKRCSDPALTQATWRTAERALDLEPWP